MVKKQMKKALVIASGEQCFWVNNGPVLTNLKELRDALGVISDEQFSYHVSKERNDFAEWVESVLADGECAKALRRTRTRKGAVRVAEVYLGSYYYAD